MKKVKNELILFDLFIFMWFYLFQNSIIYLSVLIDLNPLPYDEMGCNFHVLLKDYSTTIYMSD